MCDEASQGRIMKITSGKLGPFFFSFPIQAPFLTEYPQIIFPSLFRIMYTSAGTIFTGSLGGYSSEKWDLLQVHFLPNF